MSMDPTLMTAATLSGVSILLLLGLLSVWVSNYRTFKSSLVLGLIAFAAVLIVENVFALYFYFSTNMLYSGEAFARQALLLLRGLELAAIGFLTYVTMK